MPSNIEDYALIGNCETAALVARNGSIDWLCLPRFDSGACFAALLGEPENGCWELAPAGEVRRVRRRYRDNTLILETTFETDDGAVTLVDCMPITRERPQLVRLVRGESGRVPMETRVIIRFDYGHIIPWVRRLEGGGLWAIAGPDALRLRTEAPIRGRKMTSVGRFTVSAGQVIPFTLTWYPSHDEPPEVIDPEAAVRDTERWWQEWTGHCPHKSPYRDAVVRSLITLKALNYAPTGGIVAAPTTSLPEQLGGVRNWDYRFCWLRDATFTLYALLSAGHQDEARAWREWLLRAVAGNPAETQIMYGLAGERRLTELELDWLAGYQGAKPVRIGNAAHGQFQLDVYGEVLDAMYQCRRVGLEPEAAAWNLETALVTFVESAWQKPDEGIWEVRGPRRHFTHSKVMAWVALDRAIKSARHFQLRAPMDRWKEVRAAIHGEVCREGYDPELGSFVQYYGSKNLDAALLMIPLVGFLPPDDPRVRGTVEAVQRHLVQDGFVQRYLDKTSVDGLPGGEGAFLACTFWLADNLALLGRHDEAKALFERLLGLCNDVGLLSEEYDPQARRLVGNFPQAFSHVGLINTAHNLCEAEGPARHRKQS